MDCCGELFLWDSSLITLRVFRLLPFLAIPIITPLFPSLAETPPSALNSRFPNPDIPQASHLLISNTAKKGHDGVQIAHASIAQRLPTRSNCED